MGALDASICPCGDSTAVTARTSRAGSFGRRDERRSVKIDVATPPFGLNTGTDRRRLSNPVAEQIAASADRLEAQAAEVRPNDKQLALRLMKEATKLRRAARSVDIDHKQAERARMRRKNLGSGPVSPESRSAEWGEIPREPNPPS